MEYSSSANGVDAMISGKSDTFSASASAMVAFPNPNIEAIPMRLLPPVFPDSGERLTLTVYSLGRLNATTNPIKAP